MSRARRPARAMPARVRAFAAAVAAVMAALVPGVSARAGASARITVVAAENFYADIVQQVAGAHVGVTSIINNPNVDPHEYQASAKDAAAVATARLIIQNGLGYDAFLDRLVAASPNPQRKIIVVAALTGHRRGDNPHLWYEPATMPRVARAVVDALAAIDPSHAASYRDAHRAFETSFQAVTQAIGALRARYAGVPVAATEPVFHYMAQAIGLNVVTPVAFQRAIEDGEEPPAVAVAQMEDQLKTHKVRVLLYNTQTVSPVTTSIRRLATTAGIPVVGVSETEPPGTSYQQWMLGQLETLRAALTRAQ